jgi:hypothetical protein
VVSLPVSLVKDVCTLGGAITKQDKPYTIKTGQKLVDSILALDKDLGALGEKETEHHIR